MSSNGFLMTSLASNRWLFLLSISLSNNFIDCFIISKILRKVSKYVIENYGELNFRMNSTLKSIDSVVD